MPKTLTISKDVFATVDYSPEDAERTGKGWYGILFNAEGEDIGKPTPLCSSMGEAIEVAKVMARKAVT